MIGNLTSGIEGTSPSHLSWMEKLTQQGLSFLKNQNFFLVGIKGTGLSSLAVLLKQWGNQVTGSDIPEYFSTQEQLKKNSIPFFEDFDLDHFQKDFYVIIYSPAYSLSTHAQCVFAQQQQWPCFSYPQFLGILSQFTYGVSICGMHGKSTTTALLSVLAQQLNLPFFSLLGASLTQWEGQASYFQGSQIFICETCEYRDHFQYFHPQCIILNPIDWDHPDYFPNFQAVRSSFLRYLDRLPEKGVLFYDAHHKQTKLLVSEFRQSRPDVISFAVGEKNHLLDLVFQGYVLENHKCQQNFKLQVHHDSHLKESEKYREFHLPMLGTYNAFNACFALGVAIFLTYLVDQHCFAASSLVWSWAKKINSLKPSFLAHFDPQQLEKILENGFIPLSENLAHSLKNFQGLTRRAQIGPWLEGVLFIDDFAHHPHAMEQMIQSVRQAFPSKRLIVDFMPHTYSRTFHLQKEFVQVLRQADVVVLHPVYGSLREDKGQDDLLFEKLKEQNFPVVYQKDFEKTLAWMKTNLKNHDIFLTLGAGDNWKLINHYLSQVYQRDSHLSTQAGKESLYE